MGAGNRGCGRWFQRGGTSPAPPVTIHWDQVGFPVPGRAALAGGAGFRLGMPQPQTQKPARIHEQAAQQPPSPRVWKDAEAPVRASEVTL